LMLLKQGPALLAPDGLMALEIDDDHAALLRAAAPGARFERDLAGRTRYVFLGKEPAP